MSEFTPTRSLAIALADERRTMREGYAFLDEKCLLLAGRMLVEVRRWRELSGELSALQANARKQLAAAIARHGLNGLQVYAAAAMTLPVATARNDLLGVTLLDARLAGEASAPPPAVHPSPEAEACRRAFTAVIKKLIELAAVSSNLARLYAEYRKTVRRVRALQDVLLPELERTLSEIETSLEELEQDEYGFLRRAVRQAGPPASPTAG
jgi:V/A-type H+-transporting ATPase subunit D